MDSPPQADAELQARLRQQEVVAELGQQALETDDIDQLMRDASVAVAETLENEYATVLELLPGDDALLRQGVGWRDGLVGSATVPTELDSQAGYTLRTERPVIVEDLRTETRFSGPELLTSHDVVSGISVVIGSVENPWGVLGTHATERREFTEHDANFVRSVANILAAAIENHRTKQSLREEKEQFRQSVEKVEDYAIFTLDPDGYVRSWNAGAERIKGYDEDEILGEHFSTFYPDEAAEAGLPERLLREAATEGRTDHEGWRVRSDGSRFWASVSITALYDDGDLRGFTKVTRDLTERRERERELELFRTLLDHSNDSVMVIDPDTGRFVDVNDTACRQLGYDRDELLRLTVPDIEDELSGREAWRSFRETLEDETQLIFEGTQRRKDGTTFPVEVNVSYVETGQDQDQDQDREYVLAIVRDVTERRRRQRELEQSERRYRTLAECFPNGIVAMFDEELEYTLAAGRAFDDLDIDADDVEGASVADIGDEDVSDELEPVLRSAIDGEETSIEVEYADREWLLHAVPVTDERGDVFAGMMMAQDITERKEYQRKLEESERRYRTLAENFPDGAVALFNEDLEYTAAGGEYFEHAGISPDERIGNSVFDLYPDELVEQLEPQFRAALEGEESEVEIEYNDRYLRAHIVPVRNANGAVYAGMVVARDITARREYRHKLEESNERLEQFAYAASHDLQEPLRMISSYLKLIDRRHADALNAEAEEFLEFAVDGADRMRRMIEGLLEYSRVDTQGDPLEPVDLNDPLEDALENLQMKIEEREAEVTVESLPRVTGDANQLQQVFQNLLSNAIEYSDDEPRVHIEAERTGRMWTISVSDEGMGIEADDTDRVFEVFQRLHSREEHPGMGIGLALCQRIVERHGGDIWVESEPDEGTTFSFTLPPEGASPET